MPPRVRIDLTNRELEALSNLLSMTVDIPEWLDELPRLEPVERRALGRVSDKIGRAWRKVKWGSPADPEVYCPSCENKGATHAGPGGQQLGCSRCGYLKGEHPNGPEARARA